MRKDKKGLAALWSREDLTRLNRDTAEIMAIMTFPDKPAAPVKPATREGYDCIRVSVLLWMGLYKLMNST